MFAHGWPSKTSRSGAIDGRETSSGERTLAHAVLRVSRTSRTSDKMSRGSDLMTTLANRPNAALLVVDVQNGAVAEAHERDTVVANIASLIKKARREGVPVVWVQH